MKFTQGDASVRDRAGLTHTRRRQCGGGEEKCMGEGGHGEICSSKSKLGSL